MSSGNGGSPVVAGADPGRDIPTSDHLKFGTPTDPVVDLGEDGEWFGIEGQHVTAVEALPLIRAHLARCGVLDMYDDPTIVSVEHRVGRWVCRYCGSIDGEMEEQDWRDDPEGDPWTLVSVSD